ncbi:MAG: hypothetical protein JXB38_17730 [Anaerolineales bacterium]|nr:hypothetical protein [Anaerolineales bacterium]
MNKEDELFGEEKDDEVLFPIRLDNAIFAWKHPLKDRVLNKCVGDFSAWTEPAKYRQAFDHLVRSLKPETRE